MHEFTSKTHAITEQYLERYGRVRVGVYYIILPRREELSKFLNSLLITLRRMDLLPCYAWFSTSAPNTRYLILWCNGYFKTDLSDISMVAGRLGTLHSMPNVSEIGFACGGVSDAGRINAQLNNLIATNYVSINQYHRRSFGTSAAL